MGKYDKYNLHEKFKESGESQVIHKLELEEKFVTEWTTEDIDEFLLSFNSISQSSLSKHLTHLRKVYKHICSIENIKAKTLKGSKAGDLINPDKLRSQILTGQEFYEIRDFLIEEEKGFNYRDRVIFEFAWEGLTTNEISSIVREEDINYEYDENQHPIRIIVQIRGKNSRKVVLEDTIIIEEIMGCLSEEKHYSDNQSKENDSSVSYYIVSKYLIRASKNKDEVEVKDENKLSISQVNTMMKKMFKRSSYNKRLLEKINIESICKSRIFWEITRNGTVKDANELIKMHELYELHPNLGKISPKIFSDYLNNSQIVYDIDFVKRRKSERTSKESLLQRIKQYPLKQLLMEEDDQDDILSADSNKTPEDPIKPPEKQVGKKQGWQRSQKMSKEALVLSKFLCEFDNKHVTFLSKVTGKNFVEAHHIIPLGLQKEFKNSLDVPGNIASLCPVCHRAVHHAENDIKLEILDKIFSLHAKRLKRFGFNDIDSEIICNIYEIAEGVVNHVS